MQSAINSVLAPYTTLKDTLPSDVDAEVVLNEINNVIEAKLNTVFPEKNPLLINISGLPGSGKTVLARSMQQRDPSLLYIGFDDIMEDIPSYQREVQNDKKAAFERWEIPARFAGYCLLTKAVERKQPILFEHSNANKHHLDLYKKIIEKGYKVEIRFIEAEPDLVLPRLQNRPRYFPAEGVFERWDILQNLIPEYTRMVSKFTKLGAWKE